MAESRGIDIRRQGDTSLLFAAYLLDSSSAKITSGTTSLRWWHVVPATGALETYDFSDNTFKAGAVVTSTSAMTHRTAENGTYNTGLWTHRHAVLTAFVAGDKYIVEVSHASLPAPQQRIFQYGGVEGDALEPTVSGRTLDVTATGEAGAVDASGAALATAASASDIQARLPAALVGGRIDASVGAMAADVVTATAIATDAIGSLELAANAATEIANAVAAVLPSGVAAVTGTVASGTPTTTSFVTDLTNTTANFYAGNDMQFSTGALSLGAGARRVISSSGTAGAITLTVATAWPVAPSVGNAFRLTASSDTLAGQVPGKYGSDTAAAALGRIGSGQIITTSAVSQSGDVTVTRGDSYFAVDNRALEWTEGAGSSWPDLTGATITVYIGAPNRIALQKAGTVVTPTGTKKVRLELLSSETLGLAAGTNDLNVEALLSTQHVVTLVRGFVSVQNDVRAE